MRAAEENYPPLQDADDGYASLTRWLMNESALVRLSAICEGTAVGHVQLTEPHDYLVTRSGELGLSTQPASLGEVGKFFVDPAVRRSGTGSALFSTLSAYAHSIDRTLVLAVIDNSPDAVSFYRAQGMVETGTFVGVHGTNHVFVETSGGEE